MIKLLHISDIHLDRPFKSRNGKVKQSLKEAMRTAFKRAVSFCIEQEIDVLLIAGDLFDGETVEPGTALFLKSELDRLREHDVQVVYATGNHDCAQRIRSLTFFHWPEHVKMALSLEPNVFEFTSRQGEHFKIVACGHGHSVETTNAISQFPTKRSLSQNYNGGATTGIHTPVIGVAHSWLTQQSLDGKERYMPCSVEDLKALDYDYFALGHIHMRSTFLEDRVGYSGALQAVNRDETGNKGGIYIELEKGALKTTFVPFSGLVFLKTSVAIDGIEVLDEIGEAMILAMEKLAMAQGIALDQTLFTLCIEGRSLLKSMLEQEETLRALQDMIIARTKAVEVVIDTSPLGYEVNVEDYVETDTFLGHLLRTIRQPEALESVVDDMMHELKLTTLFNTRAESRAWVLQMLAESEEVLIEKMVKSEEDLKV